LLLLQQPGLAHAQSESAADSLRFISFAPDGSDNRKADKALMEHLHQRTEKEYSATWAANDYHQAILAVVGNDSGLASGDDSEATLNQYVARLTPYPAVAAELLGANFKILATYQSKATGTYTYHSYLVVRTKDFKNVQPTAAQVAEYLISSPQPKTFVFNDKFSTSGYLLPLLFFRDHRIGSLQGGKSTDKLHHLEVRPELNKESIDLVEEVLNGSADLAAVWDGTIQKYMKKVRDGAYRDGVYFVQLDTVLPNDLLIASTTLPTATMTSLEKAIKAMPCPNPKLAGDFVCWVPFENATEARHAFANLRRLAAPQPRPVTVRLSADAEKPEEIRKLALYLKRARQAIRMAGTELVVYDRDYHGWVDVDWRLRLRRDGVLEIKSIINAFDTKRSISQDLSISFADSGEDLVRRIVILINTELYRIRYFWPFEDRIPTILRDVGFRPVSKLLVQSITWTDPATNEFENDSEFDAELLPSAVDFDKLQFSPEAFFLGGRPKIDPLSNTAYRAILVRPPAKKPMFHALTAALVALFLLAGAASALQLWRSYGRPEREAKEPPA
jgi:ABC-type phosphate/phosphonate transport system substrate-binding protein